MTRYVNPYMASDGMHIHNGDLMIERESKVFHKVIYGQGRLMMISISKDIKTIVPVSDYETGKYLRLGNVRDGWRRIMICLALLLISGNNNDHNLLTR